LANDFAIQVREWFANNDRDNHQSNKEEAVQDGVDQEGENVIQEENDSDGAVEYSNADLYTSLVPYRAKNCQAVFNSPH
jgi:hypothetical protein